MARAGEPQRQAEPLGPGPPDDRDLHAGRDATGDRRETLRGVSDAITYAIELAVGVASVTAGLGVVRTRRLAWLAAVLLVAGVAASVHAGVELFA
jgi:hypothetical protein